MFYTFAPIVLVTHRSLERSIATFSSSIRRVSFLEFLVVDV